MSPLFVVSEKNIRCKKSVALPVCFNQWSWKLPVDGQSGNPIPVWRLFLSPDGKVIGTYDSENSERLASKSRLKHTQYLADLENINSLRGQFSGERILTS